MADIRTPLVAAIVIQENGPATVNVRKLTKLRTEYGTDEVEDEIFFMIHRDLADYAHAAAKALGYPNLIRTAASVLRNSDCYDSYKNNNPL